MFHVALDRPVVSILDCPAMLFVEARADEGSTKCLCDKKLAAEFSARCRSSLRPAAVLQPRLHCRRHLRRHHSSSGSSVRGYRTCRTCRRCARRSCGRRELRGGCSCPRRLSGRTHAHRCRGRPRHSTTCLLLTAAFSCHSDRRLRRRRLTQRSPCGYRARPW